MIGPWAANEVFATGYCRDCGVWREKGRHDETCPQYDAEQARLSLAVSHALLAHTDTELQQYLQLLTADRRRVVEAVLQRRVQRRGTRRVQP